MATSSLKITLRDGTSECFSESVGKETVDFEMMDKALNRLQEKSNAFLTIHVEKEKEMNMSKEGNGAAEVNDDEEESSDEEDEETDHDKPPEKKPKL